jgi:predicted enzyme related to lactoylglutathione lyase
MAPQAGAVLYAKDFRRLAEFYRRVAGLQEREAADDFICLESNAFQLVVLQIPAHIAETITIETPPRRRESTPIKLVLFVASVEAGRSAARENGGELNPPEREWSFQGHKVCDGVDPEGNVFQLRQQSGAADDQNA